MSSHAKSGNTGKYAKRIKTEQDSPNPYASPPSGQPKYVSPVFKKEPVPKEESDDEVLEDYEEEVQWTKTNCISFGTYKFSEEDFKHLFGKAPRRNDPVKQCK